MGGGGTRALHDDPAQHAFLDAIALGAFIELRGEVTRRTRGLVFVRGVIAAHGADTTRDVGAVDGIWRVLRVR